MEAEEEVNSNSLLLSGNMKSPGLPRPVRTKGSISEEDKLKSAAIMGDTAMLTKLLKNVSFVQSEDPEGNSPLHHCAEHGHLSMVKLLVERNANVNAQNKSFSSPLHIASVNGHLDVVSYLLKQKADINHPDVGGLTALHWAVTASKRSAVKTLLKAQANPDAADSKGTSPLHLASGLLKDVIAKLLLRYNAEINIKSHDGQTPLHIACATNRTQIANLLLERNADINTSNEIGDTPLHVAVQRGSLALVQCLLEYNAKIDTENSKGQVPGDMTAKESVRMLLRGRTVFLEDEWCLVEPDKRSDSVTVLDAINDEEKSSIVEQLGQRRKESYIYILDGAEASFEAGLRRGGVNTRISASIEDNNIVCPVLVRRNVVRPVMRKLAQFLSSKLNSETNLTMDSLKRSNSNARNISECEMSNDVNSALCSSATWSNQIENDENEQETHMDLTRSAPQRKMKEKEKKSQKPENLPIVINIDSKPKFHKKHNRQRSISKTKEKIHEPAPEPEPERLFDKAQECEITSSQTTYRNLQPNFTSENLFASSAPSSEAFEESEESEEFVPPPRVFNFGGYSTLDETSESTSATGGTEEEENSTRATRVLHSSAGYVETTNEPQPRNLMRRSLPNSLTKWEAQNTEAPDERLVKLLENLGLGKYINTFLDEEWDWDALLEITSADLMGLGLKSGSRRKVIAAIARVREESGLHSVSTPAFGGETKLPLKKESRNYIIDYSEITMRCILGKGFYGEVYLGSWNGIDVAVKKVTRPMDSLEKWLLEIELLHQLRHPNIVAFYCACVEAPNYCIVLEYVARGSLEKVLSDPITPMSHGQRLKILCDIARGMTYLHSQKPPVIHRDLKSDNVLVDDQWSAKVSDFGLSRYKDDTYSYGKASTPFDVTITPWEVLENNHISEKADVYSFGLMMWEMYTRVRAFKKMNPRWVAERVVKDQVRPSLDDAKDWDPIYVALMQECWAQDYASRPPFTIVLEKLENLYSTETMPQFSSSGYIDTDFTF